MDKSIYSVVSRSCGQDLITAGTYTEILARLLPCAAYGACDWRGGCHLRRQYCGYGFGRRRGYGFCREWDEGGWGRR
ncbi:hypothetical protein [Wenjunlia tyrosinilytica]|uniref:Uncharacterized protein n=1 Tax=Wenjunlia tyrosinilytica TaxID=1544741 RepID=A0A918DZ99_9ACTN|nr:hypothetical protein [Wenjunlia tyrosinilytica]GGO94709.1 hypothetical protein GCM10012280_50250 [Wenjunlia tyrosinilytica]